MSVQRAFGACVSVAVLLGLAACGGGQDSAEELGESMAEAFNDQDKDALVELACEKDRAKAEQMNLKKVLGPALNEDFNVELVKATEQSDRGTVTLKLTFKGKSENEDFAVKKEDGAWTICER